MKFTNLHQHTTYSFLDGYGTPQQIADRLETIKQDSIAITDHGNIYAHIPFTKVFQKANKHLVYGCEFYIVEKLYNERGYNHITVLAKNNIGYSNLLKLANVSFQQKYYKPRITFDQLVENSKGLMILSGCVVDGYLHTGNPEWWLNKFKKCEWYVELQPFVDEKAKWSKLATLAKKKGLPCLVTFDSHYPKTEDKQTHDFMLAINTNKPLSDPDRLKMDYPLHIPSIDEVIQRCKEMGKFKEEWITDTYKIAQKCKVELPKTSLIKINAKISDIKKECYAKLKKLKLNNKTYIKRLEYELDLIERKNFTDYFTIIAGLMKWAKQRMLCSPGRGSSAGSLVCYLAGITDVDSIKHNLLFERFIDINRHDWPDIDLDFPASKRGHVIEYLKNKYGRDNTTQLITFNTFKPRAIIQDAARVLKIPQWEIKDAASQIIERSSGDTRAENCLRDSIKEYDNLKKLFKDHPEMKDAIDLEGQVKQCGCHAAAVAIATSPVNEVGLVVDEVLGIDKYDAEEYGLLKVDVLGLETLDIIQDICEEVGFDWRKINTLPLDDKRIYDEIFTKGKLIGVFQFEGLSVRQICNEIKPVNFNQLVHVTALSRPGSFGSGGTMDYVRRHKGEKHEIDSALLPYTKDTYGIIIFQEQVMNVVKDIGDFSWEDTSKIRKAMSKRTGAEYFNTFKEKFIKGAVGKDISKERALDMWKQCYYQGEWAFNLSHAVSYSVLSYWSAYCKTYWPAQFYARILKGEIDEIKIKTTLNEYGGKVIPVDLNKSKMHFSVGKDGKTLIGGFTNIKGIGEKAAQKIIDAQPFKSVEDFKSRMPKGIASKITEALDGGLPWANTQPMTQIVKEELAKIKLSLPLSSFKKINSNEIIALGKVIHINLKNHNEDVKVAKRGYKMDGYTEYIVLKVYDDDYNIYHVCFDRYFTQQNKQMLLELKNKICLFKVAKKGEIVFGKSVRPLQ